MPISRNIHQDPEPGKHLLLFCGDSLLFRLQLGKDRPGAAYIRTNLGHAHITRREIIRQVELNETRQGRDWFDIPMTKTGPGQYEVPLGLNEVGHFEAKCLFLPAGKNEPLWPSGPNTDINVEPAGTVCGNIVYNAFVRQFGSQKSQPKSDYGVAEEPIRILDESGYTVIPPSGTFRDLIAELDFIMGTLGCRFIQLLPIHPTPTTYARMGRYGSPYAALSFTAVDPALAVFDPRATPLDQFLELVDAVHARKGRIIIDIAINHTGWAAGLHESHPQWLARTETGEIENPGAWGVVWADLTRLDYSHKDLWQYMADVFLTWCRRGVDGFRCDAGYMIPLEAWQYIIAKVRDQFSDVLFLLEGLGGKIQVTRDLLNRANFNWAYSELFQNYDRHQVDTYLPQALDIAVSDGISIHFAETHDNNRLASVSRTYALMRTALCALTAPYGAFGFANGVEWFATEKINVHESCALNWGAADNQVDWIARLSHLLKTHPAFAHPTRFRIISRGEGPFLAFERFHESSASRVVVMVNLDAENPCTGEWEAAGELLSLKAPVDLLTRQSPALHVVDGGCRVALAPGQVYCLSLPDDPWLLDPPGPMPLVPQAVENQRLRAKVLEIMAGCPVAAGQNPDQVVEQLRRDPETFCGRLVADGGAPRVIGWQYPEDLSRQVMVPPGFFLLFRAEHPFQVRLVFNDKVLAKQESLSDDEGRPFVLLAPLPTIAVHRLIGIQFVHYAPDRTRHDSGSLLFLSKGDNMRVLTAFSRNDCHHLPLMALGTNGRGAMMRVAADWQRLDSRYDALLAANLNTRFPEDRRIMLTRCRAWVVYQGYSQQVNLDCLEEFAFDYDEGACWRYQMITGQGEHVILQVNVRMVKEIANTIQIGFARLPAVADQAELADEQPIILIMRPDVEDRNFHHCTKAYAGPEIQWPKAVAAVDKGFTFGPTPGYHLRMTADKGRFDVDSEWYYMVHHAQEAQRGQDPDSDLFSPGYFSVSLCGGERMNVTARVMVDTSDTSAGKPSPMYHPRPGPDMPLEAALSKALDRYVVRRGDFNTIIAGFPWFLDWGRDTLIVVRGLIADGKLSIAQSILTQFAAFEENGTLPNMIRGDDAGNRDTSDAPLWFYTACADLMVSQDDPKSLPAVDCNGRTLRQVLIDMADGIIKGTPNGIAVDPESGLIYSPAHFTWMDTNYPAGTPRQGYPIEIQSLWYAALRLLIRVDASAADKWQSLASQVKDAIKHLFVLPGRKYLRDCRHAQPGQRAAVAAADDALRPNQLLAITLGAVDDPDLCKNILEACSRLLVPGAIRSLADQPVSMPLPVYHNNTLLNDPHRPYQGRYQGDEDTRRKPAYHNGTAWTWQFPSFCEAWSMVYGKAGLPAARAWLSSSIGLMNWHCVGQLPEIVDGDAPHNQRGCDAQAWGVSELLRVWKKITAVN